MRWNETVLSDDTSLNVTSVAFGNNYYVALAVRVVSDEYHVDILYTSDLNNEWTTKTIYNSGADPIIVPGIVFTGEKFVVPFTTNLSNSFSALYFDTPSGNVTTVADIFPYAHPIHLNSVRFVGGKVMVCGNVQTGADDDNISGYTWYCTDPAGVWEAYVVIQYSQQDDIAGNAQAAVYDVEDNKYMVYGVAKQNQNTNIHRIYSSADLENWDQPREVARDNLSALPFPAFAYCEDYDAVALFLHGQIYVSKAGQAFVTIPYPAGIGAESIRAVTSDGTKFLASSASDNQSDLKVVYSSGDPTVAANWRVQTLAEGQQISSDVKFIDDTDLFVVVAGQGNNLKPTIYTALFAASEFNIMKDRVPTYPGRVSLTPLGNNLYTLARADDPTEEGTKLSKVNLLSDDAALAVWNNTPPDILCTPSTALEHLGNNAFHVGDILTTARDLSTDESWLKCTGGDVSQQDYPELYAILETATIDDNWHNSTIATTDVTYVAMATDGEWFVILRLIGGSSPYTCNILYTRDPSGAWENKNIGPQCTQYNWTSFQYVNGEFIFFCTGSASNSMIPIYAVHAADPSGEWITTQVASVSQSTYDSVYVKGWTYADNKYVLGLGLAPSGGMGYTVAFCYSDTLDGNYQTRWAFSNTQSSTTQSYNIMSAPAYGNGKWVVSISYSNSGAGSPTYYYNRVYYSSDIANLNSSSQFLNCASGVNTTVPYVVALVYGNGYWVGLRARISSDPFGIIYSTDDFASITFVPNSDIGWSNDVNILFFNNRFIFISGSASVTSQKKIWYTSDPRAWESAVIYDGAAYIAFQTVSASTQNDMIFTTLKTTQSLVPVWHRSGKSLPKLSPGVGLNAYIKAKEGD